MANNSSPFFSSEYIDQSQSDSVTSPVTQDPEITKDASSMTVGSRTVLNILPIDQIYGTGKPKRIIIRGNIANE